MEEMQAFVFLFGCAEQSENIQGVLVCSTKNLLHGGYQYKKFHDISLSSNSHTHFFLQKCII
jgi:hypothetical protein